jgi:hypothetical protein
MVDFELEELKQCDAWHRVLGAYQCAHAEQTTQEPESDGWLPRVREVAGVDRDDLPRIHGKLIAIGFLKIQLPDRTSGVRYQVSPAGTRGLATLVESPETAQAPTAIDDEAEVACLSIPVVSAEPVIASEDAAA